MIEFSKIENGDIFTRDFRPLTNQGGLGYQGITAASAGLQTVSAVYKAVFRG